MSDFVWVFSSCFAHMLRSFSFTLTLDISITKLQWKIHNLAVSPPDISISSVLHPNVAPTPPGGQIRYIHSFFFSFLPLYVLLILAWRSQAGRLKWNESCTWQLLQQLAANVCVCVNSRSVGWLVAWWQILSLLWGSSPERSLHNVTKVGQRGGKWVVFQTQTFQRLQVGSSRKPQFGLRYSGSSQCEFSQSSSTWYWIPLFNHVTMATLFFFFFYRETL